MKKYYDLAVNQQDKTADIYIYGDITSVPVEDNDVSAYSLVQDINGLKDVDIINVYINSYGGEVGEGLAIYNALKRHPAKVCTYCDGFAASIASVIFCAGYERYMYPASFLMIHNVWIYTAGNADDLRKDADNLDKLSEGAVSVYLTVLKNAAEKELRDMLAAETWLTPHEALQYGFATQVLQQARTQDKAAANVRRTLYNLMLSSRKQTESRQKANGQQSASKNIPDDYICKFFEAITKM